MVPPLKRLRAWEQLPYPEGTKETPNQTNTDSAIVYEVDPKPKNQEGNADTCKTQVGEDPEINTHNLKDEQGAARTDATQHVTPEPFAG